MANEVRVTRVGTYLGVGGNQNILVTRAGTYLQTIVSQLNVTKAGVYLQVYEKPAKTNLILGGNEILQLNSMKVRFFVSSTDVITFASLAKEKLPILPDWSVSINGFFYPTIHDDIGSIDNQSRRALKLNIVDRNGDIVRLTNSNSFIVDFKIDINIDNLLVYQLVIVGSGQLETTYI